MRFSSRWAILSVAESSWALVIGCRKAVFVIRRPQSCRRRPRAFAQTNLISSIHPLSEAASSRAPAKAFLFLFTVGGGTAAAPPSFHSHPSTVPRVPRTPLHLL